MRVNGQRFVFFSYLFFVFLYLMFRKAPTGRVGMHAVPYDTYELHDFRKARDKTVMTASFEGVNSYQYTLIIYTKTSGTVAARTVRQGCKVCVGD